MYPTRPKLVFQPALHGLQDCVWRPAVDVRRTRYGWLVKAELPGVCPEHVSVRLDGNSLVLSGVRKDTLLEEGDSWYVMEISYCRFERRIELPVQIEQARVRLSSQDGVLLLRLVLSGAEEAK